MTSKSWKNNNLLRESNSLNLTRDNIEDILTDLSIIKEQYFDGEEWAEEPDPDEYPEAHDIWLGTSWDEFEDLFVEDIEKYLEDYTPLITKVISVLQGRFDHPRVSDIYDYLNEAEDSL